MKEIKIFDGMEIETNEGIERFPDMTLFDTVIKCTQEQRLEIIRNLMAFHEVDLSKFVNQKCIIRVY